MEAHDLYVLLAVLVLYLVIRHNSRSPPYPPGPVGWPLIGNLLDLSGDPAPYKTMGTMTSKYGPVIYLRALGTRYVFLNSFKVTKDILEKKSAITSNRPQFTVAGDLVGWSNFTGFLQHGDTHKRHRRIFGRYMRTNGSLTTYYYPAEEVEAKRFILNVLNSPDDLIAHCYRSIESLLLKLSHGYNVKSDDDPLVEIANKAMHNVSEIMVPGRYLPDIFPFLQHIPEWFPGGGFHRDVKEGKRLLNEMLDAPYKFVLENRAEAAQSVIGRLLQEEPLEDEEILKMVSCGMYLGGAENTSSMLAGFFLAMTMYPDVFKKAQAELDAAVGDDRLPTMEDRKVLPYVDAICTEILRWAVVVPLPSHLSTEDIIYEGRLIPKGSWLCPNIWFILFDPATYPDPEKFNPERFLGEHQQPDPREACFGWGRRRCLGERLAESIIFIWIATALATLDVSRHVENGVEWVPKYEFEDGMIRLIKPFKCKIVPRSKKAEQLLRA